MNSEIKLMKRNAFVLFQLVSTLVTYFIIMLQFQVAAREVQD